MELQEFMGTILNQLEELPRMDPNKRNYLIEDIEFELQISRIRHII